MHHFSIFLQIQIFSRNQIKLHIQKLQCCFFYQFTRIISIRIIQTYIIKIKSDIFWNIRIIIIQFAGDCDSKQGILSRGGGLASLCREIPGDAAMYSMIRVWSRPVECPLQGLYSLAYGKGGADKQCSHPPSLMDSCNDDSVIQVVGVGCCNLISFRMKMTINPYLTKSI